jgi:hypothetical protein
MILNYLGGGYTLWVVQWISDSAKVGHMAVAMPVKGGGLTILDPAGRFYTRNISNEIVSKPVRQAVEEWVEYWRREGYSDVRIVAAFSEETCKNFSSTEEFIQWVLSS